MTTRKVPCPNHPPNPTRITASGAPAEVKAKVREYVANGCPCPILYPLVDVKLMIDTFADGY